MIYGGKAPFVDRSVLCQAVQQRDGSDAGGMILLNLDETLTKR